MARRPGVGSSRRRGLSVTVTASVPSHGSDRRNQRTVIRWRGPAGRRARPAARGRRGWCSAASRSRRPSWNVTWNATQISSESSATTGCAHTTSPSFASGGTSGRRVRPDRGVRSAWTLRSTWQLRRPRASRMLSRWPRRGPARPLGSL